MKLGNGDTVILFKGQSFSFRFSELLYFFSLTDAVGSFLVYFDLYFLTEVGSQSDVVEPPLWKSKQKEVFSNFNGKLNFSLTEATGKFFNYFLNVLSGLIFEP